MAPETTGCRCSHGFSCHVCEGCRDHHAPGCPVGDEPATVPNGDQDRVTATAAHGSREIAEALGFEPDNHHNALLCPYCGDQREKIEREVLAEAMDYFMRHEGVGHVTDALARRRETREWPDA